MEQTINHIIETLKRHEDHVLTLGCSFGKDSSALLDLVLRAYLADSTLPKLHILYANTGLEAPTMARYIVGQAKKIVAFVQANNLPIQFHEAMPLPERTMWGRVIGHGYMMPLAKVAHWCTDALKLSPLKRKMDVLLGDNGNRKALAIIGVREQESGTRKVSIDSSIIDAENHLLASRKNKKETLYAPLRTWSEEDVWNHIDRGLVYTDGAEIRAVYNVTDSTGSLRSGCVFCPVVTRDKNLEAETARDPGLRWLLRWRNYLARLSDPKHKTKLRHFRRQRGDVAFYEKKARRKSEQDTWEFQRGYYPQRIREHFLKVVLHVQKMTQRRVPDFSWISQAELETIRQIWVERHGEVEDSLPVIYHRIFGTFWEEGTCWEIESGTHRWFSFQERLNLPGSWTMMSKAAPGIDAERVLRTAHALNDALDNIEFKQARGAWCDDHIDRAKELLAALMKTDWRSEIAARTALARILSRGDVPPASMPRMDLGDVRQQLRDAHENIRFQQDREWERLLDMYDRIPEEKRTPEMRKLIAEGMEWGDPRKTGQMLLSLDIAGGAGVGQGAKEKARQKSNAAAGWQQPGLMAA